MQNNSQIHKLGKDSLMPLRVVGLILTAIGLLAVYALLPTIRNAIEQSLWTRTFCTIDSGELKADTYGTDSLDLKYHYTVNGRVLNGTRYEAANNVSRSEVFYKELLERFLPGVDVECFYNPKSELEVVLSKTTFGDAAIVLIPGIFLAIGLVMLFAGRKTKDEGIGSQTRSLGSGSARVGEVVDSGIGWGRIIFFMLFVVAGLGVTYLLFGMPMLAWQETQSWTPHRCTIKDCDVYATTSRDSKTGKSSESYSLKLRYEYQVGEHRYIGSEYNPIGDRYFGRDALYEISSVLTDDLEVDCFVDPNNPTKAVINRDLPTKIYAGLFPLIFVGAGLLGLLFTGGDSSSKKDAYGRKLHKRKAASRIRNFIMYVLITVILNVIVGAVIYGVCFDSGGHIESYFPLIFASPFLLIGGLLILGIPYSFLQIFNPTVDLEFSTEHPQFGTPFSVSWNLAGNPNRVNEIKIEMKPAWGAKIDFAEDDEEDFDRTGMNEPIHSPNSQEALKEIQRLMKIEVIKPFVTSNKQMIASGKTEFLIPIEEEMKKITSGAEINGWNIVVSLSIPWYPDSLEIFHVSMGGLPITHNVIPAKAGI